MSTPTRNNRVQSEPKDSGDERRSAFHRLIAVLGFGDEGTAELDRSNASSRARSVEEVRALLSDIPGDVRRRVEAGEIPDPMWYAGRLGPSATDVASASTAEFMALTELRQEFEEQHRRDRESFEGRRRSLRPGVGSARRQRD
jgi:hypothetical protein